MLKKISFIQKIMIGMCVGILLGMFVPQAQFIGIIGQLFVGALKAIAPLLVFFIVMSALSQHKEGSSSNMKMIIFLYLIGTFGAALIAVAASFLFKTTLTFSHVNAVNMEQPQGIWDVLNTLLLNLVDNPVNALVQANYIGILSWAVVFGIAFRKASEGTQSLLQNLSDATSKVVSWVIQFAPLGILGLVYETISTSGLSTLLGYGKLLAVLLGAMFVTAFVLNPLIVFLLIRENPYPLVFKCLKVSGVTAFFTRSSAANIPVNMQLAKELGLNEDLYSVSIPLGATVNMAGAAITITTLTLSAVYTLNIPVDFLTAFILSVLATVSACGASGVTGGSLLLIPVACSLFGISNDIAMQVVGVGFIIGIIQDSCETAINSSTDVLFTAASEMAQWKKEGRPIIIPK